MRTLIHFSFLALSLAISSCGGSSQDTYIEQAHDTTETIVNDDGVSNDSKTEDEAEDKSDTSHTNPSSEDTSQSESDEQNKDDKSSETDENESSAEEVIHEAGTVIPSYNVKKFNAGRLDSVDNAFKAAIDLAYLNYYFADFYNGFYPASDTRIRPFFNPSDEKEIIENPALDKGTVIFKQIEIPPTHIIPTGSTYHYSDSYFQSQLEYFNPIIINEEKRDLEKRAGWKFHTEYIPSDHYVHKNYSRVYAAGDSIKNRTLANQKNGTGVWREKYDIKVVSGKIGNFRILEESTVIEVDTKTSHMINSYTDDLVYFVGGYTQLSKRKEATLTGTNLYFSTIKTGPRVDGFSKVYPFELNQFSLNLSRTCSDYLSCDDHKISLTQDSEGELASKKFEQLFKFKVLNNTTLTNKWPILSAGEAILSDNYGNKAHVAYSEGGITITLNDSNSPVTIPWET